MLFIRLERIQEQNSKAMTTVTIKYIDFLSNNVFIMCILYVSNLNVVKLFLLAIYILLNSAYCIPYFTFKRI